MKGSAEIVGGGERNCKGVGRKWKEICEGDWRRKFKGGGRRWKEVRRWWEEVKGGERGGERKSNGSERKWKEVKQCGRKWKEVSKSGGRGKWKVMEGDGSL